MLFEPSSLKLHLQLHKQIGERILQVCAHFFGASQESRQSLKIATTILCNSVEM